MRNLFFVLQIIFLFSIYSFSTEKMAEFSYLVSTSPGVLSDFAEDVRFLRKGPVKQTVSFEGKNMMRLQLCFPYEEYGQSMQEATFVKEIRLSDIKNHTIQYVLNEHLNSITFSSSFEKYSLAFKNVKETKRAKKLLDEIVSNTDADIRSQKELPSEIARKNGCTYLVVAPRNEHINQMVDELVHYPISQQNVVYLTKKNIQEYEQIVQEGAFCLPIFLYDLKVLDAGNFFTTSVVGSTAPEAVCLSEKSLQSAYSDDEKGLNFFFSHAKQLGIRFTSPVSFKTPLAIYCSKQHQWYLGRYLEQNLLHIEKNDIHAVEDLSFLPKIPKGPTFLWFESLQDQSFAIFRYFFDYKDCADRSFIATLYREFPRMHLFLNAPSIYVKGANREMAILHAQKLLQHNKNTVSKDVYLALQIALFSCELGAPFGKEEEIGYNSVPFACALAEKCGCIPVQIELVRYLVENFSGTIAGTDPAKRSLLCEYRLLIDTASKLGTSPNELLSIQKLYIQIISTLKKNRSLEMRHLKALQDIGGVMNFFGCVSGVVRSASKELSSLYTWEFRDSKHRDGISLSKKRFKYESLVLKNGYKQGFWQWLEKSSPLPGTTYVSRKDRDLYKVVFENGRLVAPAQYAHQKNCSLIFVIDRCNTMYVGEKIDAETKDTMNFNHASFLSGEPVVSAGKLVVDDGYIVQLSDHSGHYCPTIHEVVFGLKFLQESGVDIEKIAVDIHAQKKSYSSAIFVLQENEKMVLAG